MTARFFWGAYIMRNDKYPGSTLIDRDLKPSWSLSERVHMGLGYKYTLGTDLTHASLQHPYSHPGNISPVPKCPTVMDMPVDWQTTCIGSLDCSRYYSGKGQVEASEILPLSPPGTTENEKQCRD